MDQPVIAVDVRCLQAPEFAERGIPGHTRNVLGHARDVSALARNARLIGIFDPNQSELDRGIARIFDELRPNAYFPGMGPGSVFINPSPMTKNQNFIARLLLNQNIHKAVLLYDFIPYQHQARYLMNAVTRLDYFNSLAWLNRYDVFLSISEDTQSQLDSLFGLKGRSSIVTGVPIAPWLEAVSSPAPEPSHILAVAGDDPRKNPEILIRAHAMSQKLQARHVPLIIAGQYPPEKQQHFQNLARQAGGNPELLRVPGRVTQEVLLAQYRQAFCVVTPSRAEGFSMPVIEAMAAGVPSIASDIPAHAALVKDDELRFHPDEDAKLTRLLEKIVADADFRADIITAQAEIWPQFRAETVAKTVWSGIETSMARAMPGRFGIGGRRPRIAMLTPLPPSRSGISDFSAACARSLEKLADLDLFTSEAGTEGTPASGLAHLSSQSDRVVSILGNSYHHERIFDLHARFGSACICHDSRLLHYVSWKFGPAYAAKLASQELQREVTVEDVLLWQRDETQRQALGFGSLARTARPMIFHSKPALTAFQNRYGVTARLLPFAIYRPWAMARSSAGRRLAKQRLGLDNSEFTIISLGFVTAAKGIAGAIQAMSHLSRLNVKARLIWVGESHESLDPWHEETRAWGVASSVIFLNRFVDESLYRDYLLAADCGLQLRAGGKGNISGALQDCIAAGLPAVASQDLAESLEAPSFVACVSDALDPLEIAQALAAIAEKKTDTEAERAAYSAAHSMDVYARGLCEILELEV